MMISNTLWLLLAFSFVAGTEGFSPAGKPFAVTRSLATNAVALLRADAEDDATYLMQKAHECAFSDTCSVNEAKDFLREVVHVQSGCVAGTLVGHDLCDDQDHVAEIVSHLRLKIEQGGSNDLGLTERTVGGAALGSAALIAAVVLSTQHLNHGDAVPFTLQEWWWAMKGGYLEVMISHFMRNGGL